MLEIKPIAYTWCRGSFKAEILNIVQDFSCPATKTGWQLPCIGFPIATYHKLKR